MKTVLRYGAFILAAMIFCTGINAKIVSADDIKKENVAKVNGVAISRGDLEDALLKIKMYLMNATGKTVENKQMKEYEERILDTLIKQELLYQDALAKKIVVEKEEIEPYVNKLRKQFKTEEKYAAALKKRGVDEEWYRQKIGKTLSVKKFIDQEFAKNTKISETEARFFYRDNPSYFIRPEMVRAKHILILVDSNTKADERIKLLKKVEGIKKRIDEGEDFSVLASKYSDCDSAGKGGDLGYFHRGQMVKPFEDVAFKMNPGEVSDIVETQFGYHIIKLMEKKSEKITPYEEAEKDIKRQLKNDRINKKVELYTESLKAKANIEKLVLN